jgi:hypothetical protein
MTGGVNQMGRQPYRCRQRKLLQQQKQLRTGKFVTNLISKG